MNDKDKRTVFSDVDDEVSLTMFNSPFCMIWYDAYTRPQTITLVSQIVLCLRVNNSWAFTTHSCKQTRVSLFAYCSNQFICSRYIDIASRRIGKRSRNPFYTNLHQFSANSSNAPQINGNIDFQETWFNDINHYPLENRIN